MKKILYLLMAALLLSACTAYQQSKRGNSLDDTVNIYGKLLRWGQYAEAQEYLRMPGGEPMATVEIEKLKPIKITAYDILDKAVQDAQVQEAIVTAQISFYHEESGVNKTITNKQLWWFDQAQQHWFLASPLPDFYTEFAKKPRR